MSWFTTSKYCQAIHSQALYIVVVETSLVLASCMYNGMLLCMDKYIINHIFLKRQAYITHSQITHYVGHILSNTHLHAVLLGWPGSGDLQHANNITGILKIRAVQLLKPYADKKAQMASLAGFDE